jgi:hypothetical protein
LVAAGGPNEIGRTATVRRHDLRPHLGGKLSRIG